jgi:hypothetical protein
MSKITDFFTAHSEGRAFTAFALIKDIFGVSRFYVELQLHNSDRNNNRISEDEYQGRKSTLMDEAFAYVSEKINTKTS